MPIYQYKCKKCEAVMDIVRSMEDRDKEVECMKCGGESHREVSSVAPAQFKGRGWTPKKLERRN